MVAFGIMTFVAGEYFGAATEAEPAVGLAIMGTATISGQGLSCGDAEGVFGPFADGGAVRARCGRYEEEFNLGDLEGWMRFRQRSLSFMRGRAYLLILR